MSNTRNKNITYVVPPIYTDEDLKTLKASDVVYTSKIADPCGYTRIETGCTKNDCDSSTCPDGTTNTCCANPTTIYGTLNISAGDLSKNTACGDGNLSANFIEAISFSGDGTNITNTDDTRVIDFNYDSDFNNIVLKQANPNNPDVIETFTIPTDKFTKDTKTIYFGFEHENSNILTLKDNNGVVFRSDLSKYDDTKGETYIAKGSCSKYGNLKLEYNKPEMAPINIDITEPFENIDKYVTDGHVVNNRLILKRKNDTPISIDLYPLIASFQCPPDIYLSTAYWSGNNLILKRNDGYEIVISFEELIAELMDEINGVVGGCVTSDNKIYLNYQDGKSVYLGQTTDTNTVLTDAVWKQNPQDPNNPYKLILRFKQSDDTYVDVNFTPLLSKLDFSDTSLVSGEISPSKAKDGTSIITLKQTNGVDVVVSGLINSDTKNKLGYYDSLGKNIVIQDTTNKQIVVPVEGLLRDAQSKGDKHLTKAEWSGSSDTLVLTVDGFGEIPVSFKNFRNTAKDLGQSFYDEATGTLNLVDVNTNIKSISGFVKSSDLSNFIKNGEIRYVDKVLCTSFDDGKTLIRSTYSDGTGVDDYIDNIYVNGFNLYGTTLRLKNTNGNEFIVDLSPIVSNITNGYTNAIDHNQIKNAQTSDDGSSVYLISDDGTLEIGGLTPAIVKGSGEITTPNFTGNIKYSQYGEVLNLNINFSDGDKITPALGKLPFSLPYAVNKVVFGKTNGGYVPVKISIDTTGTMTMVEAIPEEIIDSFTISIV